ncbi:MAG: tetratricopeptide repeat protein [Verrucomicrobia bacterium]|nr:tetratricopeptide repeat protein [Verrucomicrobiota bacterium]
MTKLEPPDTHFLSAAIGWIELGDCNEARAELARIAPAFQNHPDVLQVNWLIAASEQNWKVALDVARTLIQTQPDRSSGWLHQAYALRRVQDGGLQAAWEALLPVADQFPEEPTIPYNLSCYACQLGRLEDARTWLRRALDRGDRSGIKLMALSDPDLKPLWTEIKAW